MSPDHPSQTTPTGATPGHSAPPPPSSHPAPPASPSLPAPSPTPSAASPDASPGATSTGLDPNVSGLLAYLFGWFSGLILLLVEKEHEVVRFHAAQSLVLSVALFGVWVAVSVLSFVPVLGLLVALAGLLVALAAFGLWIYLLVKGYRLEPVRLPVIAGVADDLAAKVGV